MIQADLAEEVDPSGLNAAPPATVPTPSREPSAAMPPVALPAPAQEPSAAILAAAPPAPTQEPTTATSPPPADAAPDPTPANPRLLTQLRTPPGGRDARTMLLAFFVDRVGTGVWSAASVLYFTFVVGLGARQIGVLVGVGGALGIAGSPLAGRLVGRFRLRDVLIACHVLRLGTVCLLLLCRDFAALLPVVAVLCIADRVAKTLEILFASRVAGERRATYRALSRVAMNAGWAVGAAVAALGLAIGTRSAYSALVLANAASFLVAAVLAARTREYAEPYNEAASSTSPTPDKTSTNPRSPWRDPRYLLFVLLDTPMNLDDAVLSVALPLWLVTRTSAPHTLVPAFLIINTVLVVVLQLPVANRVEGPYPAARAVVLFGLAMLAGSGLIALSASAGTAVASVLLLGAAVLVTLAELMRSVSSWELAISLAPPQAQAAYLGVAGMSLSVARSAGPILLTNAVMLAGPPGWLAFGGSVTVLSLLQRRLATRRLRALGVVPQ